jgi:uncharacterized protein (DUF1499 family)
LVSEQQLFSYTALAGWFLGAYAKLRKATICLVMPVNVSICPPARNNSNPIGRIFMKFDMGIFRNSVEKIQVSLDMTIIAINLQEYICIFMTSRLISVITVRKCLLRGTT